jgi:ribosome-binding factor A
MSWKRSPRSSWTNSKLTLLGKWSWDGFDAKRWIVSFKRADRVSEAIKREVSVMLTQEVKDPGIHFVTVTDVKTTDDLRNARIYVSVLGDEPTRQESMRGLERAKGFLRGELGRRLQLRYTPEIQFYLDTTLDNAMKIKGLLNSLKTEERNEEHPENEKD